MKSFISVGIGAALGAIVRWLLSLGLNMLHPLIPLGTLAANLIGGYLAGVCMTLFAHLPTLAPEWRLFIVTGFLGGLTTFSTFSAEVIHLMHHHKTMGAILAILLHVGGSLSMTLLGVATVTYGMGKT